MRTLPLLLLLATGGLRISSAAPDTRLANRAWLKGLQDLALEDKNPDSDKNTKDQLTGKPKKGPCDFFKEGDNYCPSFHSKKDDKDWKFLPNVGAYRLVKNPKLKFSEAQQHCESMDANLAVINSEQEETIVKEMLANEGVKAAFLGITDKESKGQWKTVDGQEVKYTRWRSSRCASPNYRCASLLGSGAFKKESCDQTLSFVCEARSNEAGGPGGNGLGKCFQSSTTPGYKSRGPGWQVFEEFQRAYRVIQRRTSWAGACEACEKEGANLVVFDSREEAKAVVDLVKKATGQNNPMIYIGVSDLERTGRWVTVTGERVEKKGYNAWIEGRKVTEDCAVAHSMDLRAADCWTPRIFVCEAPAKPRKKQSGVLPPDLQKCVEDKPLDSERTDEDTQDEQKGEGGEQNSGIECESCEEEDEQEDEQEDEAECKNKQKIKKQGQTAATISSYHQDNLEGCPAAKEREKDGWEFSEEFGAYKLFESPLPWSKAYRKCVQQCGNLAIIESIYEVMVVVELLKKKSSDKAWVGINSLEEPGMWMTLKGDLVSQSGYANWKPGEPTSSKDGCGLVEQSGRLAGEKCDEKLPFICKSTKSDTEEESSESDSAESEWGSGDSKKKGRRGKSKSKLKYKIDKHGNMHKGVINISYEEYNNYTKKSMLENDCRKHINFQPSNNKERCECDFKYHKGDNCPAYNTRSSAEGWVVVEGFGAYKIIKTKTTFCEAQKTCNSMCANLVVINNKEEAKKLTNLIAQTKNLGRDKVFVGVTEMKKSGCWLTVEGERLFEAGFNRWGKNEPDNWNGRLVYCAAFKIGGWLTDISCCEKVPFMCEAVKGPDLLPPDDLENYSKIKPPDKKGFCQHSYLQGYNCPDIDDLGDEWVVDKDIGAYTVHKTPTTWCNAMRLCQKKCANLAIINSIEEAKFIDKVLREARLTRAAIGISAMKGRSLWVTINDIPIPYAGYENWAKLQPKNLNGNENCGSYYVGEGFNDHDCLEPFPVLCEAAIPPGDRSAQCPVEPENAKTPGKCQCLYQPTEPEGCPHYSRRDITDDWKILDGVGAYRVSKEKNTWCDAMSDCATQCAELVVPQTQQEVMFLADLLKDNVVGSAFIGITDFKKHNCWVTLADRPAKLPPWGPGQPVHGGCCAAIDPSGQRRTADCCGASSYVCKAVHLHTAKKDVSCSKEQLAASNDDHRDFSEKCSCKYKSTAEYTFRAVDENYTSKNWKTKPGMNWYWMSDTPTSWCKAQAKCASMGMNLAVINSKEEMKAVRSILKEASTSKAISAFVGINGFRTKNCWQTVEGQGLDEAGHDLFRPGHPFEGLCGAVNSEEHDNYYSQDCCKPLHFLCEKPKGDWSQNMDWDQEPRRCEAIPSPSDTENCPKWQLRRANEKWQIVEGLGAYRFFAFYVDNWENANTFCKSHCATLVEFNSKREYDFVLDLVRKTKKSTYYDFDEFVWIGLHSIVDRETWITVNRQRMQDASKAAYRWLPGHPGEGYCGALSVEGGIKSSPCCEMRPLLCEAAGQQTSCYFKPTRKLLIGECSFTWLDLKTIQSRKNMYTGWISKGGHGPYKISDSEATWCEAVKECQKMHSNLVVPETAAEADALVQLSEKSKWGEKTFLIGISLIKRVGCWMTLDDKWQAEQYYVWAPPKNPTITAPVGSPQGNRFCGAMRRGGLTDVTCHNKFPFICEGLAPGRRSLIDSLAVNTSAYSLPANSHLELRALGNVTGSADELGNATEATTKGDPAQPREGGPNGTRAEASAGEGLPEGSLAGL